MFISVASLESPGPSRKMSEWDPSFPFFGLLSVPLMSWGPLIDASVSFIGANLSEAFLVRFGKY